MNASIVFQKLIKDLPLQDQKYINSKINKYNRLLLELFVKKIYNYPFLINLLQKEIIESISPKLQTEDQYSFFLNVIKGNSRTYIKAYNFLKRKKRWN